MSRKPKATPKRTSRRPTARRSRSSLAVLADITSALSASRDPERVLTLVASSASRLFDSKHIVIALLRKEDHQILDMTRADGLSARFVQWLRERQTTEGARVAAIASNTPLLVPNLETASLPADFVEAALREGLRAYAELPLITQGDIVGILSLYFRQPRRFRRSEVELLQTYASQAALAIANARLYTGIENSLLRYSQQLQALRTINRELSSTLNPQHVFEMVVERAMEYTSANAGCLLVAETGRAKLAVAVQRGYRQEVANLPEKRSTLHLVAARVQESGRPVLFGDVQQDPLFIESGEDYHAHLSVPIKHEGATLGVLALEDSRPDLFTQDHLSFINQLAAQTAIAIRNARLFHSVTVSRDRLEAVLNSTREGVLVVDASGRIALANERLEELWGLSRAQLLDQNLSELVNRPSLGLPAKLGYSPGELLELLINLSQRFDVAVSRHVYHLDSPAPRFLERTGTPVVEAAGQVIGWVVVLRDVSEEMQLQSARDELTRMIVHDLRSPITSVLGSLKLIEEVFVPDDKTGMAAEAVEVGLRAAKRMTTLVDSMLDVFRSDTGGLLLNVKSQALKHITDAILADFAALGREYEITLLDRVPDDLPDVLVDTEKTERIFTNLVDNAFKFAAANSEIVIAARPASEAGFVVCEVIDSGQGIPADYLARIFDRYVQVSNHGSQRRGLGLGLTFCKLAVEAHGGRIWAENREGGGSKFSFTLPVAARKRPDSR